MLIESQRNVGGSMIAGGSVDFIRSIEDMRGRRMTFRERVIFRDWFGRFLASFEPCVS